MWAHSLGDGDYWASRLPWLLPGLAVAAVLGLLVSSRLGRWLGVPRLVAWALVVAGGAILAGTMSTVRRDEPPAPGVPFSCDFSRVGPADLHDYTSLGDPLINVLLFIPLGVLLATVPASPRRTIVLIAAASLPFVIEALQSVVTGLGRGCESADVVDNLIGLAVGLVIGTVGVALLRLLAPGTIGTAGVRPGGDDDPR